MPNRPERVYGFGAGNKAATYDLATNRWLTLPDAPDPDRSITAAVWTGTEILALRTLPMDQPRAEASAAALDPRTNTWRTLPATAAATRSAGAVAWTGTQLLVWGGRTSGGFSGTPTNDGARYRPPQG